MEGGLKHSGSRRAYLRIRESDLWPGIFWRVMGLLPLPADKLNAACLRPWNLKPVRKGR